MALALQGLVINAPLVAQAGGGCSQAHDQKLVVRSSSILKNTFLGSCSNAFSPSKLRSSSPRRSLKCNASGIFDERDGESSSFAADDENYVTSTVIEAVEVKSGSEGFMIKMRDGRHLRCEHNNVEGGHLPDYAPQPAIVLKMEDESNLLLPIIVLELPCTMLMEAMRNSQVERPTVYHVMKDMIDVMGFQPLMVRVTKRVHEAYYARLYVTKVENGKQKVCSLDVRPSDGINLAVRCKIPIQVNKQLASGDGVRIIQEPVKLPMKSLKGLVLDHPDSGSCSAAEEFVLVRSMMIAAVEERYSDAARLRDQLSKLRAEKKRQQEA